MKSEKQFTNSNATQSEAIIRGKNNEKVKNTISVLSGRVELSSYGASTCN